MAAGVGLYAAGTLLIKLPDIRALLTTTGAILLWGAAFLGLFGADAARRNAFALGFLALAVPLPSFVLDELVQILVTGSTLLTRQLFALLRVPFVAEGPVLHLPGFSIEIAQSCSGIRSSLALLVTAILAGHMFLRSSGKRILLALAVLPVALIKNAVRVVTLYLSAFFIDSRIIERGLVHGSGGLVFFGLGLLALAGILGLLRSDGNPCRGPAGEADPPARREERKTLEDRRG